MNKQQLVDAVGERLGDRTTAATAVEAVLDTVSGALADGEKVSLFGFGVFEKVDRPARTARNPSTGGTVQVPATSVPRFRAGRALKDAVAGSSRPAARRSSTGASSAAEASSTPVKSKTKAKAEKDGKGKGDAKAKGKGKGKSDSKAKGKASK